MRIDGWKSVAAYFGKERSTVIRWASERHMPVHRIPGQKRSGVYALSHELDEWLRIANPESEDRIPVAGEAPHGFSLGTSLERMSTVARRYRTRIVIAALVLGLFVIGLGALSQGASQNDADNQLPRDRRVAALYLDARSDWAERSQPSIELAIEKLKKVVKLAPDFAPGYAALADCYVLAREFGSLEDGEAFPKAQSAIKIALRMDPTNSDALRVKGFVEYWWNGDAKMALDNFRAALRNGGSSAQTHFWLGNVLVDGGDYTEGIVQLNKARLLNPNSPAVDTDLAWAHWSSGNRELGKKMMEKLAVKYPNLATIHDYLSVMYLEDENREGFIEASRHLAELRGMKSLHEYSQAIELGAAKNDKAMSETILNFAQTEIENGSRKDLLWPAYVASSLKQRGVLIKILHIANARREVWYSAGMRDAMRRRWEGDNEVSAMLSRLSAEPLPRFNI